MQENSRLAQELSKEQQRCRDLSEDILRLQSLTTETVHSKVKQYIASCSMASDSKFYLRGSP